MSRKSEAQLLIAQLCIRFERKPRKCKKRNDSGIGTSQRIVCVANQRFYYYPKIQQFNDLDFDKLQYVVPKAGVKLQQILQLKFPPRRDNERNYFTIVIPKNRILKYGKTSKETIIDQFAQGEQQWTFVFDYDIISLPQYQKRLELVKFQQKQKLLKKKQKQQQQQLKKQEQTNKKMEQQYDSLVQTEKLMLQKQGEQPKMQKKDKQKISQQQMLQQADQYYYQEAYVKLCKVTASNYSESQLIQAQLDLIQSIGKFKKRAQQVIKKYIDELPYNLNPIFDKAFVHKNLIIKIGYSKHLNIQFLDTIKVAEVLYTVRKKIDPKIRVPLFAFMKYKGFKVLIRSVTPCDSYGQKQKQQLFLHGNYLQNWKTHFFLVDDLNTILDALNLKPYNTQVYFQRILIHFGTHLELISTKKDPFQPLKKISKVSSDLTKDGIIYAFYIKQIFPIDLDLQKNIKQDQVRIRPQYVKNYRENGTSKQLTKLVGGALTYQYEDQQGAKDDLALAKACQYLKYIHVANFVQNLDKLKFVPMNSDNLRQIMKENGINMRYISTIYKLTALPYIRQIITIQAITRQIKKIYRDYQMDFTREVFRNNHNDIIKQANDSKSMNSLKVIRNRQLLMKEKAQSIQNSIDFLNLIFGNGEESQNFWQILKKKVKQNYKIVIKEHTDLSHGYLLMTILYRCGFKIKLNSSLLLFAVPQPFSIKDWLQFQCKSYSYTYPQLEVYKKCKINSELTEQTIINRLQLSLYICRAFGNNQSEIISELSTFTRNPEILSTQKYTIQSLKYYFANASAQNFVKAYDICTFVLPSSHPYFQDFYLQYSKVLNKSDSILLKRAAENHALRTLGIDHQRTSNILSDFKQQSFIKHLLAAERGVENNKKMQLLHKIIKQQAKVGKFFDCFNHTKIIIQFAEQKKYLNIQQQQQLFNALITGIQVSYRLRKIQDLLKISQYFWNYLQKFRRNVQSHQYFEHILHYCVKGFLQSSNKKYFLFKIVLILNQKINDQNPKQIKIQNLLATVRQKCKQSKNHINWIKQLLTKLQFAYTQLNFLNDFFTHFWSNIKKLRSDQLFQGLEQMQYLVRIFKKKFFEEALLDRSYTFDKGTEWDIPK